MTGSNIFPFDANQFIGDAEGCRRHGRDSCEECIPKAPGLDPAGLADANDVAAEGRLIEANGVPYIIDGIVPDFGMLGMLVAYAKVGKTTLAQAAGAAVSSGAPFIGRSTKKARVLVIAAEDPPEYTAWVARHLVTEPGAMTFYRRSVLLNDLGLVDIAATVKDGGYGLVLISSWQAVVRGLLKDENDNAGAVTVVERVKAMTRQTRVPWLIDAHAGKGEDQNDEADPSRAMRGASAAAGAADYTLWLRYADGAFGSARRLSGKGRFVNLAPLTLAFDESASTYDCVGSSKDAANETTWRQIAETGALSGEPRSAATIAKLAGIATGEKCSGSALRRVHAALAGREGVAKLDTKQGGKRTTLYSHAHGAPHMGEGAP